MTVETGRYDNQYDQYDNQYDNRRGENRIRLPAVDGQPRVRSSTSKISGNRMSSTFKISAEVRDSMSLTIRNIINDDARKARANRNIHNASKVAVVGVFASVVGVVESVARIVCIVVVNFFNSMDEDGIVGWEPEEKEIIDNSLNLIGYHLTNIATLGFFGFSIRDKDSEKQNIEYSSSLNKGDAYGLVDVKA